jgi:hypothetical protein
MPAPAIRPFELDEATAADLQAGMSSGKFTAHSLAEKYLERIDEIDQHGLGVNAVIELNPDALSIAAALDKERKKKGVRGPLHGIPLLIKDNIETADTFAYIFGGAGTFSDASDPRAVLTEQAADANSPAKYDVSNHSLVLFDRGDEVVVQAGDEGIRFLLVSGKPIEEPVAW